MTSTTVPSTFRAPDLSTMLAALLRADLVVLTKNKMRMLLSLQLPLIILSTTSSSKATRSFERGGVRLRAGHHRGNRLDVDHGLCPHGRPRSRQRSISASARLARPQLGGDGEPTLGADGLQLCHRPGGADPGRQYSSPVPVGGTYGLVLLVSVLASAVFLSVAQALVGLVKSADTVQAFGRLLYIGLVMLGLFGASGQLGGFWDTVSKWTPVGALMKVFAGVVGTFDTQDWLSLLVCAVYVIVLTTLGIYWFRFDAQ